MVEFRIRYKPLIDKVTDPDTACKHIQDGTNVFVSGFTAGYPKLIPQALVRRVEAGERFGSQLMNGIGGSGDFIRNGFVSFIVTPSVARGGKISAVVPMVSHVDHSEHSVDVVVTEHGLVDTRPLTPRQVAEEVIKKCAHPDYRDLLWEYYQRAIHSSGGHEPHLLSEVFDVHQRFMATGDMKPPS